VLEAEGKLKRFAMNQYHTKSAISNLLGADKGHVGQCEGALTGALRAVPDAVVVLDEFEKADPSFAEACFLNAFGAHGFFSDSCADNGEW
jgi:ATP-dependent Clp protease ATP-binding subunit ClpA